LIISNYKKKLRTAALYVLLWAAFFVLGCYMLDNIMLFSISIDSNAVFYYPYEIVAENVMITSKAENEYTVTSFAPQKPSASKFSSYKSLEENFSFNYPSAFIIDNGYKLGGEILYHVNFRDRDSTAFGFAQVWKMDQELEDFLKNSKETSNIIYKYFKSKKVNINGVDGIVWDYSIQKADSYQKGCELFLKKDDRMYRLSYFVPENKWNKKQAKLFKNMAKSFKIK
jgi:hypothetical protein